MIETPYKKFFHTLGNQTRLAIIYTLKSGEKNVTELTEELKLKQTTVSHDLRRLEQCQFVKMRQDGPFRYYSLNKETIEPLLKLMDKHVKSAQSIGINSYHYDSEKKDLDSLKQFLDQNI